MMVRAETEYYKTQRQKLSTSVEESNRSTCNPVLVNYPVRGLSPRKSFETMNIYAAQVFE